MPRLLLSTAALTALLVASACDSGPAAPDGRGVARSASPTRPQGPMPPYVLKTSKLDEAGGERLAEALRGLDGVASVDVDGEAGRAEVEAADGRFLYRPDLEVAVHSVGAELVELVTPAAAQVTVYVVDASGGG